MPKLTIYKKKKQAVRLEGGGQKSHVSLKLDLRMVIYFLVFIFTKSEPEGRI